MRRLERSRGDRIKAAAIAGAIEALMLYLLFVGLRVAAPAGVSDSLKLFGVAPPPPPVEEVHRRPSAHRAKQAPSPPNLRATPTEVVAPKPIVLPPPPPPVVAAPIAGTGAAPSAGASNTPGPGYGAGGNGNGLGGGGDGDDGDDGPDDDGPPPRHIGGRLKFSDLPPPAPGGEPRGGTVGVKYAVEPDGRVDDCTVTRSSGDALLDATTCRLIEQRFRYKPARDHEGNPVRSYIVENHSWGVGANRDEYGD